MDPALSHVVPFAVSFALGLLVGVERQRSGSIDESQAGGIRTFPLIAVLGCSAAWAGVEIGMVAFGVIAVAFSALVVASYATAAIRGEQTMATSLAFLLTFIFGTMAFHDRALVASALAVATTTLLSLRAPLHELAKKIEEQDLYAALKLAALTLVVLPLLPDRTFGPEPYDVLNPFRIWLLVVLIAAISFAGYLGTKLLGPGRGILAAGALGGLASSTAVTVSFSGRSRETPDLSRAFALAIAVAWATMFGRVLFLLAVVNPALLRVAAIPLGAPMLAAIVGASLVYLNARKAGPTASVSYQNPFSLSSAFKFGAFFMAIMLAARFAQLHFQDAGILATAAISGTVDVDASTLTVARLSAAGGLSQETAVRALCVNVGTNTVVKALIAAVSGAPALRRALLPVVIVTLVVGAAAVFASF